jgi:hypothetical protein
LGVLLGDSAFGDVRAFRDGVRALGFDYALDVKGHGLLSDHGFHAASTLAA